MQENRNNYNIRLLKDSIKSNKIFIAAIMITLFSLISVHADNFVVTTHPTSDPAPTVFTHNGETRVYLYCTQDIQKQIGDWDYPIDTLHCYSSDDMFHWRDDGCILDEQSCASWVNKGAHQLWAPTVVFYKGKYRLFVSAVDKSRGSTDREARVFTATADSPTGPFIPSTNPPYFTYPGVETGQIDPFCFIDTMSNGQTTALLVLRLNAGAKSIHMAQLNDDATNVVGAPWVVRVLPTDGYKEGTWVFKRNGFYYLIYATDREGEPTKETIEYATAPVPATGSITEQTQWTYRGVIFQTNSKEFTIHSGACHFAPKGETEAKWYVFWHGVQEPEIGGNRLFPVGPGRSRCTGIEQINFTNDNPPLIPETPKTKRGVGICNAATDNIQVDRYSSSNNCNVRTIQHPGLQTAPTGWVVSDIKNNGTCTYTNVSFTPEADSQFNSVAANVSSTRDNCSIELRIGSKVIATVPVPNTGNLNTYATSNFAQLADIPAKGIQDLTLVFKTPADNCLQVNWIKFGKEHYVGVENNYGVKLDQSGYNFQRVNNTSFKVFCRENVANATVAVMDLQGRAVAGAVAVRQIAPNGMKIDLNQNQLSNGVYLLSVRTANQMKRIRFTY